MLSRHGRGEVINTLTSHYSLAVWLTSSLGSAKLAAQFYFYHFNMVSHSKSHSHSLYLSTVFPLARSFNQMSLQINLTQVLEAARYSRHTGILDVVNLSLEVYLLCRMKGKL